MGFGNGYDSGYSDAIADARNGKVAGVGPASDSGGGEEIQKKCSAVIVEGGYNGATNLGSLPDGDVLRITVEDLGAGSTPDKSQTLDFNRIADKLAPVVALDIFWNLSTIDVAVTGPEGYNWAYLSENCSPGGGLAVALSATGDTFPMS